ncbi:response regulator transcription factor [Elusimicrobiota bacterium]
MSKKILVIEDDIDEAGILKNTLEAAGHEIFVAHSGMEGIRRAEELLPDLITLDIMLQGIYGYDVLKKIKSNEAIKNIPVLVISAMNIEDLRESRELGAVDFVQKPLHFKKFREKIQTILEEVES